MRITTTINLDADDYKEAKALGFNISEACREGIKAKLKTVDYEKMTIEELEALKEKQDKILFHQRKIEELKNG